MLIVVSDTGFYKGEAACVNAMFEEGLEIFHLRKPATGMEELQSFLEAIHPRHLSKIALHSHHRLVGLFGLRRLHYTEAKQMNTAPDLWPVLQELGYRLSTSIHKIEEAKKIDPCFEYCFLGPVFNSISKPGYISVMPGDSVLPGGRTKLIAIGGINAANAKAALDMGFDGVATLGFIWQNGMPIKNFQQIREACS
ncbi:thiamine phosphate synthase [Sediminibacterium soli]|uniref:thiamine phosphate synthase n=1 Tax=Sediminibacterium soli TaxID=2698829 RepID=UPI00137B1752|nr:thiamine phosphate synthase [Sediminibacterium soli]NCI46416.1 thiamine phosphate synthase [Sediminibacterium soli]